jgi:hypothetical protein
MVASESDVVSMIANRKRRMSNNKRLSYLVLAATLCFIFLWRNERSLYAEWRESILRESQIAKSTLQTVTAQLLSFNVTFNTTNHRRNIHMGREKNGRRSYSRSKKRMCNPYLDPSYCGRVQPNRTDCSCEKDLGAYHCCQRAVLRVHKMGMMAVRSWRKELLSPMLVRNLPAPEITSHTDLGTGFRILKDKPIKEGDYRHVVVTRNWYDALISGYLYHKSGKECWLDWFGRANFSGWLLQEEDWEQSLLSPSTDKNMTFYRSFNMTWNPGNGRLLCQYLIDESEEMGLKVYTAWAMDLYLYPLLDFQQRRQEQEKQIGRNRTKYVCYEQFTNPSTQSGVYHDIAQWLLLDRNLTLKHVITPAVKEKERADHTSSKDHALRERLHAILRKLDKDVFGNAIELGNAQFGCGSK